MSVITISPVTVTAGQRARVAGDAVISAYINELAGSRHAELHREEQSDGVREGAAGFPAFPHALAA
jgi:hypothetical protein